MYVRRISVSEYRVLCCEEKGSYVQYCLAVHGATPYLNPTAFYDPDSCLVSESPVFSLWTRFRCLKKLHRDLQAACLEDLPDLPANKWVWIRGAKAAEARKEQLQAYFSKLLERETVRLCEPLTQFCAPRLCVDLCVVGCMGVGKMRLVDDFYKVSPSTLQTQIVSWAESESDEDHKYPERANFPVDMVVDRTLIRVQSIEVRTIDLSRVEELLASLEIKDGLIFTYTEKRPETLEPLRMLRRMLHCESIIAALDCEAAPSRSSYSVATHQDILTVFEHLLRGCLRRNGTYY